MTRFLLSGVLLLLATVGSSPSTNVLAEKVKPIALTATISMHSSETNNVDTNEEVTVPEDSADGFKPPKIPKAEQSSQINRKGNKLGGKKKMNYAKRIGTTQSAAESHPTAFYNQNKRPRGERGGVNRDSEDAVATTEAKPDEGGGGSSPARIIPSNKDIVEEELALVQDEKELLLLMEEKAQKEASRDQRTRGEVSNLLEGTQKKDGKIGTTSATTDTNEEVRQRSEVQESQDDEPNQRGSFLVKPIKGDTTNGIWVKPTSSGNGGIRRHLKLSRRLSSSSSSTTTTTANGSTSSVSSINKRRRTLKEEAKGTGTLKANKTSSKGHKVSKEAKKAAKSSPIDCKERKGKKCKKGGVKEPSTRDQTRITLEGLEEMVEPDFSLLDLEEEDYTFQRQALGLPANVGGSTQEARRFYNGNTEEAKQEEGPVAAVPLTSEKKVPEPVAHAIPNRRANNGFGSFRARNAFYGQADSAEAKASSGSTQESASGTATTTYDQYEAWFNEIDLEEQESTTIDSINTGEGTGEETLEPDNFIEEDEEQEIDEEEIEDGYELMNDEEAEEETIAPDEEDEETLAPEIASDSNKDEDEDKYYESKPLVSFFQKNTGGDGGAGEVDLDSFLEDQKNKIDTVSDNVKEKGSTPATSSSNPETDSRVSNAFLSGFGEKPATDPTSSEQAATTFASTHTIPEGETAGDLIRDELAVHSETTSEGLTYYVESVSAKPIYVATEGSVDLSLHKEEVFNSLEPLLTKHLENVFGDDLLEDYQLTITYVLPEDEVIQLRRGSDAKSYTTQLVILVLLHLRNQDSDKVADVTPALVTETIQSFFDFGSAEVRTFLRVLNAKGLYTRAIRAQNKPHTWNHEMEHAISSITATDSKAKLINSNNDTKRTAIIFGLAAGIVCMIAVIFVICYNCQRHEKKITSGRTVLNATNAKARAAVDAIRNFGSNAIDSVRESARHNRGRPSFNFFPRRGTANSRYSNESSTSSFIQPAAIQLRRNRPKSVQFYDTPLAGRQDDACDPDKKPSSIYDIDIDDEGDLQGVRSRDNAADNDLVELENDLESDSDIGDYETSSEEGDDEDDSYVDRISVARNKREMEERFVDEDEEIGDMRYPYNDSSHYARAMATRSAKRQGYRLTKEAEELMTQKSFAPLSPLSQALEEALADETPRQLTHTARRPRTPPIPPPHRKKQLGKDPEPTVTFIDAYHYGMDIPPPASLEDMNIMQDEYINQNRWRAEEDDESTNASSVMTGMTPENRVVLHDSELSRRRQQYRY